MKKIILNETHIRQLVRETLENLILDNDDIGEEISTQYLEELIGMLPTLIGKDWDYELENYDLIRKMANIKFYPVQDERFECIDLIIYFDVDVDYVPYSAGDYWTPSEGGYYEINDLEIERIDYKVDDNYSGSIQNKNLISHFSDLIYSELSEKIEEYYSDDYDEDYKYEEWKDRHL